MDNCDLLRYGYVAYNALLLIICTLNGRVDRPAGNVAVRVQPEPPIGFVRGAQCEYAVEAAWIVRADPGRERWRESGSSAGSRPFLAAGDTAG